MEDGYSRRGGPVIGGSDSGGGWPWIELMLVAAVALLPRLLQLDHAAHTDEFNHVLAARSLLDEGTLSINGGVPYDRGWAYTALVAGMFALFGEGFVQARLPAVLFGVCLVVAVFAWLRSRVGRMAAWTAALLLAADPLSINLSQMTRFYTLHALLFFLGAVALFTATLPHAERRRAAGYGVLAVVALAGAFSLQITTIIGVGALALWLLVVPLRRPLLHRLTAPGGWKLGLALAAAVVAAGAVGVMTGFLPRAWGLFRYADAWAEWSRNQEEFYHRFFVGHVPTLWTLLPVSVLVGLRRAPRETGFCAIVFGAALGVHSLAAWKADRYIFYLLPLFYVIIGIAVAVLVPHFLRLVDRLRSGTLLERLPAPVVRYGTLLLAALFLLGGNDAFVYSYRMATTPDEEWRIAAVSYRGNPDWERALEHLQPHAEEADVLLASTALKPLYYFDRADFIVSLEDPELIAAGQEFPRSPKTQVPVIMGREPLGRVMSCYASGLVIVDEQHWRNSVWGVPRSSSELIELMARPVELPANVNLHAFRWDRPEGAGEAECDGLPGIPGGAAGPSGNAVPNNL